MLKKFFSYTPKMNSKGFTLFELLISLSVIAIIAGIVLYNHRKFETDIEITNLAYRIALETRQAQIYGVSVRQFVGAPINSTGGAPGFDVSYGLHFDTHVDNAFVLFADGNDDDLYTTVSSQGDLVCDSPDDGTGECVEKFTIGRNNRIIGWCGVLWSDTSDPNQFCAPVNQADPYNYLDIQFKRPNPDAIFHWYNDYEPGGTSVAFNKVCQDGGVDKRCNGYAICLISPQERKKRVVVYETGQISVENVEPGTTCDNL